jgi:hypothetical protein
MARLETICQLAQPTVLILEDQENAEADVSTKEKKENAHSRFPGAHSYE